jgi:hypothetical protein
MHYQRIYIPKRVAEEVGSTAVRSGVVRDQAIGAALWVFSRLSVAERAALIRDYVSGRREETLSR